MKRHLLTRILSIALAFTILSSDISAYAASDVTDETTGLQAQTEEVQTEEEQPVVEQPEEVQTEEEQPVEEQPEEVQTEEEQPVVEQPEDVQTEEEQPVVEQPEDVQTEEVQPEEVPVEEEQPAVEESEIDEKEIIEVELEEVSYLVPAVETSATARGMYSLTDGQVSLKDSRKVAWIDRLDLTDASQIRDFYDLLVEASNNDGVDDFLIDDSDWGTDYKLTVEEITGNVVVNLTNAAEETTVENEVGAAVSKCAGEIFENYSPYIIAVRDAFDRDHPEVFWLSGESVIGYGMGCEYDKPGTEDTTVQVTYTVNVFMVLKGTVNEKTFDIRATDYQSQTAIKEGIKLVNSACEKILAETESLDDYEKIKYFNKVLTESNEYNTSSNLDAIAHDCRECVSAFAGRTGTVGPVCEAYARAMKVLCDRAGIPCVLVDGKAYSELGGNGEAHMWNNVQLDGSWYGVDVTWNDPTGGTVEEGENSAVSGNEGEEWLFLGSNTEISGMTFAASHPAENQVSEGGVAFTNGPELSAEKYVASEDSEEEGETGEGGTGEEQEKTTYKISLETNGGIINSGNITEYDKETGAILPTDVTKEGWIFVGWCEDEACESEIVKEIPIGSTQDKTFYAKWKVDNSSTDCIRKENGEVYTGYFAYEGQKYYANSNGILQSGWIKIGTVWRYFDDAGSFCELEYQTTDNYLYTLSNGNVSYFTNKTTLLKNSWLTYAGFRYYFDENGFAVKGWHQDGIYWYYADESGKMLTGAEKIGDYTYYFDSTYHLSTGWKKLNGVYRYFNVDEDHEECYEITMDGTTGWVNLTDGRRAYIDASAGPLTGWRTMNEYRYHFNSEGFVDTGLFQDGRYYYYAETKDTATTDSPIGNVVRGGKEIDGKIYGFHPTQYYRLTGWQTINGERYYFQDDCSAVASAWYQEGDFWYYADEKGCMLKNEELKINDRTYYFDSNYRLVTGWVKIDDQWRFFNNGDAKEDCYELSSTNENGWLTIGVDGRKSYINSSNNLLKGWQNIGEHRYYFDSDGIMKTGMFQVGNYWYYAETEDTVENEKTIPQGAVAKGIKTIGTDENADTYIFHSTGYYRLTGWQTVNGKRFFLDSDGKAKTGLFVTGGKTYYAEEASNEENGIIKGTVVTGRREVEKQEETITYVFHPTQYYMLTGWQTVEGKRYYIKEDGSAIVNDWYQEGDYWYYADENGHLVTTSKEPTEIDGKYYYFDSNYRLGTGWKRIGDKMYFFDSVTEEPKECHALDYTGELGNWLTITEDGRKSYIKTNYQVLTGWQTIDGKRYYFDTNGIMQTGLFQVGRYYYYAETEKDSSEGVIATGAKDIAGKIYGFHPTQYYRLTGWQTLDGERYYFKDDCSAVVSDWYQEGNYYYYADAKGRMARNKAITIPDANEQTSESHAYYFDNNYRLATGWIKVGDDWRFYDNKDNYLERHEIEYTKNNGWITLNENEGRKSYFNAAGSLLKGWQTIDNQRYYFDSTGIMETDWFQVGNNYYYAEPEDTVENGVTIPQGAVAKGIKTIGTDENADTYVFHSTGYYRLTGWQTVGKKRFFLDSDGKAKTGLFETGGKTYYGEEASDEKNGIIKGTVVTGRREVKKQEEMIICVFHPTQYYMLTGWQTVEGKRYYIKEDGSALVNQWYQEGDYWYHAGADGSMAQGRTQIGDQWYYFDNNYRLSTGWKRIGDVMYFYDSVAEQPALCYELKAVEEPNGWVSITETKRSYIKSNYQVLTGWQTIGTDRYYFDSTGIALTGEFQVGRYYYYANPTGDNIGALAKNTELIGEKIYGFHPTQYYRLTGWQTLDGERYYFQDDCSAAIGWFDVGGYWYYADAQGKVQKDVVTLTIDSVERNYYFDSNYRLVTGWVKIANQWRFFNISDTNKECYELTDGSVASGWVTLNNGKKGYIHARNGILKGWQNIENGRYYFDNTGILQTGWFTDGTYWYYAQDNGCVLKDVQTIDGNRYYFNSNYRLTTGWVMIDKKWKLFDNAENYLECYELDCTANDGWRELPDGRKSYVNAANSIVKGWQTIGEHRYYFDSNGIMETDWFQVGNYYYYAEPKDTVENEVKVPKGAVAKGAKNIGGKIYGFHPTGYYRLSGWQTIGTERYYFDEKYQAVIGWHQEGDYWYYADDNGCMAKGLTPIGNDQKEYYFDNNYRLSTGWKRIKDEMYFFDFVAEKPKECYALIHTDQLGNWIDIPNKGRSYIKTNYQVLTGWQNIGTERYYFDSMGILVTGEFQVGRYYYYAKPSGEYIGALAKNTEIIDGKIYGFHPTQYYRLNGWQTLEGKRYYFQDDCTAVVSDWYQEGNYYYYADANGHMIQGKAVDIQISNEQTIETHTYYFDNNYRLTTGWVKIGDQWAFFDNAENYLNCYKLDATPKDGWRVLSDGRKSYVNAANNIVKGWLTIGEHRYYFDSAGIMETGEFKVGNYYYYAEPKDTVVDDKAIPQGAVAKGIKVIGEDTYVFHPTGYYRLTGWQTVSGKRFFLDSTGKATTGLFETGGRTYYAKTALDTINSGMIGEVLTGRCVIGTDTYVFHPTGYYRLTGWQTINGQRYYIGADGRAIVNAWYQEGDHWYHADKNGYMAKGRTDINGKWYYFDNNYRLSTGWKRDGDTMYFYDSVAEQPDLCYELKSVKNPNGWVEITETKKSYIKSNYQVLTGWQTIGTNRYYFDGTGIALTGEFQIGRYHYYAETSGNNIGALAKNAKEINGKIYGFHPTQYYRLTGWQTLDGARYYFQNDCSAVTGWYQEGNYWYYAKSDGSMLKGEKKISEDSEYYYFDNNYRLVTGWVKDGTEWKFFDNAKNKEDCYRLDYTKDGNWAKLEDGRKSYIHARSGILKGWQNIDAGRYYFDTAGIMETGWFTDGSYWYYATEEGIVLKGLQENIIHEVSGEKKTYYFDNNYRLKTGWITINNVRYHFNGDEKPENCYSVYSGTVSKGWFTFDGKKSYFNNSLNPVTGWQTIDSKRYYFDATGIMQTDWFKVGAYWYYANSNGTVVNGMLEMKVGEETKTYYFDENYRLQTGWQTINGKKYYIEITETPENYKITCVGSVGAGWQTMEDGRIFYADSYGNIKTGWQTIDKQRYYFDATGILQIGWFTLNGKTYYAEETTHDGIRIGTVAQGAKSIAKDANGNAGTETYVFHSSQYYMLTGFQSYGGKRYYLQADGKAKFGWFTVGTDLYYGEKETAEGILKGALAAGAQEIPETPDGKKVSETYFFHITANYRLTGWQAANGKRYYLDMDGTAQTDWFTVSGKIYYGEPETVGDILKGTLAAGAKEIEKEVGEEKVSNTYFFHASSNYRLTGWQTISGQRYYLNTDGTAQTGWFTISGKTYYAEPATKDTKTGTVLKGTVAKGKMSITETKEDAAVTNTYYFHPSQYYMLTGWQTIDKQRYYFNETGAMEIDWFEVAGYHYYADEKGIVLKGLQKDILHEVSGEKKTYYFDTNYRLKTGWQTINGKKYFFENAEKPENCYQTNGGSVIDAGWFELANGQICYADSNGNIKTGWQTINRQRYYFDANGVLQTGWFKVGNKDYYGEPKIKNGEVQKVPVVGAVASGIKEIDGETYCFHPSQYYMLTGWQTISGQRFYLNTDGKAQAGWFTLSGKKYYAEESTYADEPTKNTVYKGTVVKGAKSIDKKPSGEAATDTYVFHSSQYYMLTGFQSYGGKRYYLQSDGTAKIGWFTVGTDVYYGEPETADGVLKGTLASGAKEIEEAEGENKVTNTYFFHTTANYRLTGWQTVNGQRYYLNADGVAQTGWFTVSGKIYYGEPSTKETTLKGTLAKGAKVIDGKTYVFHSSQYYRMTGWQTVNGQRYYLNSDGTAKTGWFTIGNKSYYAEPKVKDGETQTIPVGVVASGIKEIDGETYCFHPNQYYMLTGWQTINKQRFYLDTNGKAQAGWFTLSGKTYYAEETTYEDETTRNKVYRGTVAKGAKSIDKTPDKKEVTGTYVFHSSQYYMLTGFQSYGGKRYYLQSNGIAKTGWFTVGTDLYYGEPTTENGILKGTLASGAKEIDTQTETEIVKKTYFFHASSNYRLTGWQTVNGQRYYLDTDGTARTGWFTIGGKIYYGESSTKDGILQGTLAKGAKEIERKVNGETVTDTYVFHSSSNYRLTGWQTVGGQRYYLDKDGKAKTDWFTVSGKTYYAEPVTKSDEDSNVILKGTVAKGLKTITKTVNDEVSGETTVTGTYYFHPSQYYMLTGWQTIGKDRYYFDTAGVMETGWFEVAGYDYYANSNGTVVKGLVELPYGTEGAKKTYYFDNNYRLKTGWQIISGKKYFFENKTEPAECYATVATYEIETGWIYLKNGQICYANSRGAILTGWQTIEKERYYFDANGVLQIGWFKVGNNRYYGEPKAATEAEQKIPVGAVAKGIKEIGDETYCFHTSQYYMLKGWQTISGQRFYLDTEGKAQAGWFALSGKTYYAEENTYVDKTTKNTIYKGTVAKGAKSIDKKPSGEAATDTYFFHSSQYYMLTGFQSYGGKRYYLQKDGTAKTGWFTVGTDLYYGEPTATDGILKGTLAAGAKEIEETVGEKTVKNTYFFHASANYRLTGWQTVNGQRYYLDADGTAKTGWFTISGKIYYGEPDATESSVLKGTLAKGAKEIERNINGEIVTDTYVFHTSSNYRLTGWQTVGGQRYYLDKNGIAKTDWFTVNGKTYYAEPVTKSDEDSNVILKGTVAKGKTTITKIVDDAVLGKITVTETYYFHPSQYYKLKGWQTIGKDRYYFDENGVMKTGWFEVSGYDYYAKSNGTVVKGLVDLPYGTAGEEKTYYFDNNYRLKTGWYTISGKKYFFTVADTPEECYGTFEGSVSYGWMTMENGQICYADSRGNVKTGWQTISGQRYYFDANGILQTNWFDVGNNRYYAEPKAEDGKEQEIPVGAVAKGIKVIGTETYVFHTSQYYMLKGWQTVNGHRFYLESDGTAKTNMFKVGNYWYYGEPVASNGVYKGTIAKGLKVVGDETYIFHSSQYYRLTGFQSYGGKRYYLQSDGTAKTGWFTVGTDLYYGEPETTTDGILKGTLAAGAKEIATKSGTDTINETYFFHTSSNYRLTGWQSANGQKYYLDMDGTARTEWFTINGQTYYGEPSSTEDGKILKGSLVKGAREIDGETYVFHNTNYNRLTGWQTVEDKRYYLQANGKAKTGWFKQSGYWYYGTETAQDDTILKGAMKKDLRKITVQDGEETVERTYYFDANYRLGTGWKVLNEIRYFFNNDDDPLNCYMLFSGQTSAGWFEFEDGTKSYFNSQGNPVTGWQTIEEKRYYFDANGIMQTGWCTINGTEYFFNADGIYIPMTAPTFASITSTYYKTVDVKWNLIDGVQNYTLEYSTNNVFPSWETVSILIEDTNVNTYRIEDLEPDTTYYFRLRYTTWSSDEENAGLYYSQYSAVKSIVVRGEVAATATSATISDCQIISGSRESGITVQLQATLNDRLKSADDQYYIVETESYGNAIDLATPVGSVDKAFEIDTTVVIDAGDGSDDVKECVDRALMNKFALAILKDDGTYQVISTPMGITNPEMISENTEDIFKAISKKGIQGVYYASDSNYGMLNAKDQNSKQTLINMNIEDLVGTAGDSSCQEYVYKGKTYYFSKCEAEIDNIKSLNAGYDEYMFEYNGKESGKRKIKVCVTVNLLLGYDSSETYLIDPAARTRGYKYYTLNVREEKARETYEALFFYLGEIFGQDDCYVTNWILGNEVNSSRAWNYQGSLSQDAYMQVYAAAFRLLYNGVKAGKSGNNVYISLDNGWTAAPDTYSGKSILDKFALYAQNENPDMLWSIAYHGYSYPLTRCDFWNDHTYTTNNVSTRYISMKNINVLTEYAAALEDKYDKPEGSIRIILSEQGYNAGQGAEIQAQALARGYYIAEFNDRIDAFIIRAVIDDVDEMRGGLYLGIRSWDETKRISFYVYEFMDSSIEEFYATAPNKIASSAQNQNKVKQAQKIIGETNWESIIPNFSRSKLAGMY